RDFPLNRLQSVLDVQPDLQIMSATDTRELRWWIDDHFKYEGNRQLDGPVLAPSDVAGLIDDLDSETLLALMREEGIDGSSRLSIWWSKSSLSAALPLHLIAAHIDAVWYPGEDVFVCHPPDRWGLFLHHEGHYSFGHYDPEYAKRIAVEDCRQS